MRSMANLPALPIDQAKNLCRGGLGLTYPKRCVFLGTFTPDSTKNTGYVCLKADLEWKGYVEARLDRCACKGNYCEGPPDYKLLGVGK